jgi:SAM-dependent methyltransferase
MDKDKWLNEFKRAKKLDKFSSIVDMCQGKTVLDVGCVGQDKGFDHESWLHGRIKKVASKLIGADINDEGIQLMNDQGFEVYQPEDLVAKNEKFDLVVMGDVIEHVNDPGAFLSFYAQFLNEGGKMIICTPNSFGIRYTLQVLLYGKPGTNEEHTLAFDPYVMLELFSRINLEPTEFYWLKEYRKGANWKQKIILFMSSIYIGLRKYFNSNFMFIVKKNG